MPHLSRRCQMRPADAGWTWDEVGDTGCGQHSSAHNHGGRGPVPSPYQTTGKRMVPQQMRSIYGRVSWGELGSLGKGRGGDLVMVERPWNCGMEKVGSGSRGGLPGRTGGRDISFHRDFIHLCNLHLFIAFIFYAPGILLGAKETEKNPVQSLPS